MLDSLVETKLYIPKVRRALIERPRLLEKLRGWDERKMTLVSAAGGFGKTSLLAVWAATVNMPIAWLSLDESDSDPWRFLFYLAASLHRAAPTVGKSAMAAASQAPSSPSIEPHLTSLINEMAALSTPLILILDDYHLIDSEAVDQALAFLLRYQPPRLHLVIATREDPNIPLARWRTQGQIVEIRSPQLRFSQEEAARFLSDVMGLSLSSEAISTLEERTEGWIAGLQLAALSLQGQAGTPQDALTWGGSHAPLAEYLLEEVLQKQTPEIQRFLLQTAFLERFCGDLCDAVLQEEMTKSPKKGEEITKPSKKGEEITKRLEKEGGEVEALGAFRGQALLESVERANLFLVPLDQERRWYRYHHLFASWLQQRASLEAPSKEAALQALQARHRRASLWYEAQGLDIEAFHHAVLAQDIDRAALLVEGKGMPLHFRGGIRPVLRWFSSLPQEIFDQKPALSILYASALLFVGRLLEVEPKLQAAERVFDSFSLVGGGVSFCGALSSSSSVDEGASFCGALPHAPQGSPAPLTPVLAGGGEILQEGVAALEGLADVGERAREARHLRGHIAAIRATLAIPLYRVDAVVVQSQLALSLLGEEERPIRASMMWTLGYARHLRGERAEAMEAYQKALAESLAIDHHIIALTSSLGIAALQEADLQLHLAAQSYRTILARCGEMRPPVLCQAYIGLAEIAYAWDELEDAQAYIEEGIALARQLEQSDRAIVCLLLLARLRLASDEMDAAWSLALEAQQSTQAQGMLHLLPAVFAMQIEISLRRGDIAHAEQIAKLYEAQRLEAERSRESTERGESQAPPLPVDPMLLASARLFYAKGDVDAALALVVRRRGEAEARGWRDEALRVVVFQSLCLAAKGRVEEALRVLRGAWEEARASHLLRLFLDEGSALEKLVATARKEEPQRFEMLARAFVESKRKREERARKKAIEKTENDAREKREERGGLSQKASEDQAVNVEKPKASYKQSLSSAPSVQLYEALSTREIEILQLIAAGYSNREIAKRLFVAETTIKGHNQSLFAKLGVQRRTQAVARAREIGLL